MAKSSAILSSDRSAASTVALVVLCGLGVIQLATIAQVMWRKMTPSTVAAAPSQPAAKAQPVATSLPPLPQAPAIVSSVTAPGSLPPLPALPGSTGLPPLPSTTTSGLPPLPKLTGHTLPPPALAATRPAASAPPQPKPAAIAPTIPKTGNAQVDELVEVAAQSRDLNDAAGAMQALERADLILPDNPTVLREKALTFGKLGQADKAQQLWDRISRLGPGAGATSSQPMTTLPPPQPLPGNSLNNAFASLSDSGSPASAGPLSLGECMIIPDTTVVRGQKMVLKMPVRSRPGTTVGVNDWNLDVFFYDRVDEARVEPTKSDPVVYSFDMPVDFATGEEVVKAVYQMPELSPQDIANNGHREYYGYVVKLYYQHRLMSTAASPRDLLTNPGGPGAGAAPAGNPLLPLPRP